MEPHKAEAAFDLIIMKMRLGNKSLSKWDKLEILRAAQRGRKALQDKPKPVQQVVDFKSLAAGERIENYE